MDGDRGDLAELVKKRNTDYDFPPPFTNKFVGAENNRHSKFKNQSGERMKSLIRQSKFQNRHLIFVIPQQATARIQRVIKE